jgi:hypothetical protein
MALSPNYGFPEPDNSNLVKNGAQDIRALGDAIDSFLFRPFSKNSIINGAMDIWQRGTSLALTGAGGLYLADRWQPYRATTGATASRQLTSDTTNLPFIQYCQRMSRDSGNASTTAISLWQSMENVNSTPFIGQTVTFSFYARAGANYSAASSILVAQVKSGTGTDQNAQVGLTGSVNVINQNATLTTTWQRFSYSGTVGTTATQLAANFVFIPVGTAGAADYFEVTGVQLEIGNQASPFTRAGGTIQGELAACQRYYWRETTASTFGFLGFGSATSSTDVISNFILPVEMRVTPTALEFATLCVSPDNSATIAVTVASLTTNKSNSKLAVITTSVASGLTQYRPYFVLANNSTSAYIAFSAEL